MMRNKKGEEMVEAAMVLPLVILVCLSLILVMLHNWDIHHAQIKAHRELIKSWNTTSTVFEIKTKKIETSTQIRGAVQLQLQEERTSRSYVFSPAVCLRLEEMVSFDEE